MIKKITRLSFQKLVLTASLVFCFLGSFAQQEVSYYFQAHADDWQLFMSANAWDDAAVGAKVVFVTLTAGQAEYGAGNVGDQGTGTVPYYIARERGSIASTIFMSHEFGFNSSFTQTIANINGHKIRKVVSGNIVNYFLRLSDGGGAGEGYANERYESLKKLHDGDIKRMFAIDTSAVYTSWQDLVSTLQAIIRTERNGDPTVFVNCADTNIIINPGDHPDHFNTSLAVQDAVASFTWAGIAQYIDYYTQNLEPNLSTDQLENASALEASDILPVIYANYASTWEPDHKSWLPADYFRVTRFPADPNSLSSVTTEFARQQSNIVNSPVLDNIFPNPVSRSGGLTITLHARTSGKAAISLLSLHGTQIMTIEKEIAVGKSTLHLPIGENIAPGNYYVRIVLNNKQTDIKQVAIR